MRKLSQDDTIAAIATSVGESGIGIVRMSGPEALSIADNIFLGKDRKKPSGFMTYTVHYGWVVDKQKNVVDEVVLTVMRKPRSYTKEDVVEINCHGGILALRRILDLTLENGCRLAEPGEFTKRAFLNGRIDLTQAEAVLDIIRAKTDSALAMGVEQLKGGLSMRVNGWRDELLDALSVLEAGIDFPDDEIPTVGLKAFSEKIARINNQMKSMLENARFGRFLREGVHTVICGRPNVGKSSLLNALLRQERSIVTAVPGTTRDTIEEVIDIKGIPVRIVDTAGILEPRDLIEKHAVRRSKKQIDLADLIILLFDGAHRLTKDDKALVARLRGRTTLAVINKIDMPQKIERAYIAKNFKHMVEISAKKGKNIALLEDSIAEMVFSGKVNSAGPLFLANMRHTRFIKDAQKLIAEALNSIDNGLSWEFIAQDLKEATACLDGLLGKNFSEDLLDKIFSDFCIGK
ncbi:MAG: tRNA uridine-5-carboxymethylaminomethyl(34) synthesis GTPase MnmE [Candidatus Omnitrophica bacterium]|nr:tRNA uridine-5-carboxymethylaminomethyl(34) synthesis GTPase MnmE [Candidatus Omnitrophota bacterium]